MLEIRFNHTGLNILLFLNIKNTFTKYFDFIELVNKVNNGETFF